MKVQSGHKWIQSTHHRTASSASRTACRCISQHPNRCWLVNCPLIFSQTALSSLRQPKWLLQATTWPGELTCGLSGRRGHQHVDAARPLMGMLQGNQSVTNFPVNFYTRFSTLIFYTRAHKSSWNPAIVWVTQQDSSVLAAPVARGPFGFGVLLALLT